MQYFGVVLFIILLSILHKSFPHLPELLFDFYKPELYHVDARREDVFPKISEVNADD